MNELPHGWTYSYEEMEKAFRLSKSFNDTDFINHIYSQINYLQFLGKSYSYWKLSDELKFSYIQNYLILFSSIIEALFDKIYREKLPWCNANCQLKPGGVFSCSILENYYCSDKKKKYDCNRVIKFSFLIKMAYNDGLLDEVSETRINVLREIRNNIHLTKIKKVGKEDELISVKTINSYIKDLKTIVKNIEKWNEENKNKCIKRLL